MDKAYLKEHWSKYCDTDKLVDDTMALLNKYNRTNTEHGVCTMLHQYFINKAPLIELFMTSKNYQGDMRICLIKEFDRQVDGNEVYNFFKTFTNIINLEKLIVKQDSNGKCMIDYLKAGRTLFDIDSLPTEENQTKLLAGIRSFNYSSQATIESQNKWKAMIDCVDHFKYNPYSALMKNVKIGDVDLRAGTKTSRAFNKVCTYYGIDKFDGYNKLFAQYADLVSELKRKMRFFISLNPLDYLTMSFGVNWISCHNIDSGGWKNGCLSYMLDKTSIITFVVNNTDESPIHEIPKVYRQMYHYENSLFMQNRLYPQGNDGATNLYDKFRNFIIEEFSDILNVEGMWRVDTGKNECACHVKSKGAHYVDYARNDSCYIFYPLSNKDVASNHVMTVGHDGICVICGGIQTETGRLNHRLKSECQAY